MNHNESPIACVLNALKPAEQLREKMLLDLIKSIAIATEETEGGYKLALSGDPMLLVQIGEFISLERRCCPFLAFELTVDAENGPVSLHLWGRKGVKMFLTDLLKPA